MNKFIAAIESLHPGCEVVDVRFMFNSGASLEGSLEEIDQAFASAVAASTEVNPDDLC